MASLLSRMDTLQHRHKKDDRRNDEEETPTLDDTEVLITNKCTPILHFKLTLEAGSEIPVLFAVSEIVTKEGSVYSCVFISNAQGITVAMFLKDITKLKAQEQIIELQKKNMEDLLENILPKMIKDKLERNPDKLIAEKFDNVTIAFADIVEYIFSLVTFLG